VSTRADFVREVLSIWDSIAELFPEIREEHELAVSWLTKTYTTQELERQVGSDNAAHNPKPDLINARLHDDV
jgi:hypothetical protein